MWSIYLIRCRGGALYTGIATDVGRRIEEHRRPGGRGAKYLRGRAPLELVYQRRIGTQGMALSIERRVKALDKAGKERLLSDDAMIVATLKAVRKKKGVRAQSKKK